MTHALSHDLLALPGDLFGAVPQPDVAAGAAAALRSASGVARDLQQLLVNANVGSEATWLGEAAVAARRETVRVATALLGWGRDADALAARADRLAQGLQAELVRRRRVHEHVLAALGRLAQLPTTVHRDLAQALQAASHRLGWDGETVRIGAPADPGHRVRLPRAGTLGWDAAMAALRSVQS